MIKELYIEFIKNNKLNFFLYFLTLSYIPINKILIPKLYGNLISGLEKKDFKNIKYIFIYLIGGWFITQVLNTSSSYLTTLIMPKFKQFIRKFLVTEIFSRYKNNYEEIKMGDMITKIIKTPYILEDVFWLIKDFFVRNIFILISLVFYLFYYNKKLGLLFVCSMSSIILITYIYYCRCKNLYEEIEINYDKTHEEIEDIMSNLISIFNSRKTNFEKKRIENIDNKVYKGNIKLNKCKNKFRIIYTIIFIIIVIGLNYYSYNLYLNKEVDLKTFISIFIINYSLLDIFMSLFSETNDFMSTQSSINLLINYLKNELPKKQKKQHLKIPKTYKEFKSGINIEFKNVSFKYSSATKYSLTNINLEIKPNEKIIIVGSVGSGKSTLSKLILRFLNGYQGEILLNGLTNKKINVENLRSQIVYIPQHPNLFNRSLRENLLYGLKNVTIEDIFKKLDQVGLSDLKKKFKSELDNNVGKLGSNLSGGQRQIVWLLRNIFFPSKVIILDEPTASLDHVTKKKIISLVKEISKNRTIIIITHDKSIMKEGFHNRLIKMKQGKIEKIVRNITSIETF